MYVLVVLYIVLGIVLLTSLFWVFASFVPDQYDHKFSKKKIAITQMLCVFWPIGLIVGMPYLIFLSTKKAILWLISIVKIIFDLEKNNCEK